MCGYTWHKKIKHCSGYSNVQRKAAHRLSRIAYARLEDDKYVAVIKFKWWIILIFILALLIGFAFVAYNPGANVPKSENRPYVIEPEKTENEAMTLPWSDLYITVPGYKECVIDGNNRAFQVYNPENNECLMEYIVLIKGNEVSQSHRLRPGETENLDFYDRLVNGKYTMDVVAGACSLDGTTVFNSVKQTIHLTVIKGDNDNE